LRDILPSAVREVQKLADAVESEDEQPRNMVAWHHDGAAKGPKPIGFGNCWVVAGIVVQLPFLSRPVCLPVLARLWLSGPELGIGCHQRFRAAGSSWLMRPPRIGRRRILP
jgi:hypothetical protein